MVHDNEDQNQRQKQTNHRLWRYEKVLYLSASSLCQHMHLLRCVRYLEISIFTSGKLPNVCETSSAVMSIWIARQFGRHFFKKISQITTCKKSMGWLPHLFAGLSLDCLLELNQLKGSDGCSAYWNCSKDLDRPCFNWQVVHFVQNLDLLRKFFSKQLLEALSVPASTTWPIAAPEGEWHDTACIPTAFSPPKIGLCCLYCPWRSRTRPEGSAARVKVTSAPLLPAQSQCWLLSLGSALCERCAPLPCAQFCPSPTPLPCPLLFLILIVWPTLSSGLAVGALTPVLIVPWPPFPYGAAGEIIALIYTFKTCVFLGLALQFAHKKTPS